MDGEKLSLIRGYPRELLKNPSRLTEYITCCACNKILRDAVQHDCGYRFCAPCVQEIQSANGVCPTCPEEKGVNAVMATIYPDYAVRKTINKLVVICPNYGCLFENTLGHFISNHQDVCPHAKVSCTACRTQMERVQLQKHCLRYCTERTIICRYCQAEVIKKNIKKHTKECFKLPFDVDGYKRRIIPMDKAASQHQMQEHVKQNQQEHLDLFMSNGVKDVHKVRTAGEENVGLTTYYSQHLKSRSMETMKATGQSRSYDNSLPEHFRQLQGLDHIPYNGTLIWKIPNFRQNRRDAISGERRVIYSPFFYTSERGYRFCCTIHLNGYGMGKDTNICVMLVTMKGEYDDNLQWPFRKQITFILMGRDKKRDVEERIQPGNKENYFCRPISSMNRAVGCPLFFGIRELMENAEEYIIDNTLFIKVIVT